MNKLSFLSCPVVFLLDLAAVMNFHCLLLYVLPLLPASMPACWTRLLFLLRSVCFIYFVIVDYGDGDCDVVAFAGSGGLDGGGLWWSISYRCDPLLGMFDCS